MLPVAVLLPAVIFGQSNRTACALSPEVEKEVRALPSMTEMSLSWEERVSPRRLLAMKYPGDWPLQIALQDAILRKFHIGREWDWAIAHYRSLPDRTLGEMLEARLLAGLHREKSRAALDRVVAQAPDSPWVHLALLEWAVDGPYSITLREFAQFRRLCPHNLRAFHHTRLIGDRDTILSNVGALRGAIETKKKTGFEEEDFNLFQYLWKWEKILYGSDRPSDFEQLVRRDLSALRNHPRYNSSGWYSALRVGYEQMLKDQDALEPLKQEIVERVPNGAIAYWISEEQWRRDNPRPETASREEMDAYRAREEAFLLDRLERFWGQPFARFDAHRFFSGRKHPAERVERLADLILSLAERYPDVGSSWPPVQIMVAEAYVNHRIRLDRVPRLIDQGLEEIEYQEKRHGLHLTTSTT
jgi:hypothetical protein